MGLPKGYKKTWNSGGRKPKPAASKIAPVYLGLTAAQVEKLDRLRGELSRGAYVAKRLDL